MLAFARERGAIQRRAIFTFEEDEQEEANVDEMDESDNDEEEEEDDDQRECIDTEPFVFPPPNPPLEFNDTIQCMRFTPTAIPQSVPAIKPGVLKGLASNEELTRRQKRTVCGHMCMPMPVESSPIVALFMTKVADGAAMPWKPRYVSWMMSAFHVRELYLACINGLIEFHKEMTPEKIEAAHNSLKDQLFMLEQRQDERVAQLFVLAKQDPYKNTQQCLVQFVKYLEEYSLYYLHLFEWFLFTTLIELHCPPDGIKLEHVLTRPVPVTLEMCVDKVVTRQMVVDFFAIKVPAFQERDAAIADYEYVPKQTINLQQLPHRITVHPTTKQVKYNCPANTVYNGYIDVLTIYEYFCFCDTENVLGDSFPWDPNTWV